MRGAIDRLCVFNFEQRDVVAGLAELTSVDDGGVAGVSTCQPPQYPSKVCRASPQIEINRNTAAAGFATAGVTLGVGVLTGAPLRFEAKTAGAGQKLGPGELVLKSEPRCYGKRPPRPTNQSLAGPVEP